MKKLRIILLLLVVSAGMPGWSQARWNSAYQTYINQYKDLAIREMLRYHIPASITLAQGLLESGAGQSELALKGNNHFGIKCHGWTGRTVYHDDDDYQECFRAYKDIYESYEDHSQFLARSPRYSRLFRLDRTDYKGWARGLKECGYATNPNYANKLIEIIQLYRLHELDKATSFDRFIAKITGEEQPAVSGGPLHPIYIYNKNYYLYAREGDTFKSIGQEINISWRKIAKYNERDKHDVLQPGEIIYLKKKQTRADRAYKKQPHIVKEGESMYSIAQRYGIRLKSLYAKNHLSPDHQIAVGQVLRVY